MSKARVIITAVVVEGQSQAQVARDYHVSQAWVSRLVARYRNDRVSYGNISLRINGNLHHIGVGRTLDRTPVLVLMHDLDVRIIHAATGEVIRTLTIDPERRYHGTGQPRGRPTAPRKSERPEP